MFSDTQKIQITALLRFKGITESSFTEAAIIHALSLLAECPPEKDTPIINDLVFAQNRRRDVTSRLELIIAEAEKSLLATQSLEAALRNRIHEG